MKSLFSAGAMLLALVVSLAATSQATTAPTVAGTTSRAPSASSSKATAAPVVVAPGEQKTAHGVTVTNGNYNETNPTYAGSSGKAKIKVVDGITEVKTEGGFKGKIDGLSAGETAVIGTNSNPVDVRGNGGSVSVGSGSTVCITNTGGQGSTNITATVPGGSVISIPPGSTATITG